MQVVSHRINTLAQRLGICPKGEGEDESRGAARRLGCVTRVRAPNLISTLLPPPLTAARPLMSRSLLNIARTLRASHRAPRLTPLSSSRAASTTTAAKAAENLQSLIREKLNGVSNALSDITAYADWAAIEAEAEGLKNQLQDERAWEDKAQIAQTMKLQTRLGRLEKQLSSYRQLQTAVSDVRELAEIADVDMQQQLLPELDGLLNTSQETLVALWLSDPVDANSAYIDIHAGSGGTEACDWASMLARMYTRWAHSQNYTVEIVDESLGDVAGIKSTTLLVNGPYAYGYARYETGVHRLVRTSPFDANGARHTSFASVRVTPHFEEDSQETGIEINPSDLKITTMRSQGAGGQHVNKTESAVRVLHVPSGIVVSCQIERSQHQNRRLAIALLRSKLYELEQTKRERAKSDAHGSLPDISWGSQIRSYVLHPYQLVKDVRTNYETTGGGVDRVLDGDLSGFMEASLRTFRAKKRT